MDEERFTDAERPGANRGSGLKARQHQSGLLNDWYNKDKPFVQKGGRQGMCVRFASERKKKVNRFGLQASDQGEGFLSDDGRFLLAQVFRNRVPQVPEMSSQHCFSFPGGGFSARMGGDFSPAVHQ